MYGNVCECSDGIICTVRVGAAVTGIYVRCVRVSAVTIICTMRVGAAVTGV